MMKPVPLKYAYRLISHGPVTLLTTRRRGRPNVRTIAWVTPVDPDIAAAASAERGLFDTQWKIEDPRTLHHLGGTVFTVPSG